MTVTTCTVHDKENALKFTSAIQQLRREKKFHSDIYQQLPEQCCSCDGKEGLKTIHLVALRKICRNIQISWASTVHLPFTKNLNKLVLEKRSKAKRKQVVKDEIDDELERYYADYEHDFWTRRRNRPDKCRSITMTSAKSKENRAIIHRRTYQINLFSEIVQPEASDLKDLLILPLSSISDFYEQKRRLGLFIGKQGRHIRRLEDQYKVRVNIITETSSRKLSRDLLEIMRTYDITDIYRIRNMYLIFTAIDALETKAKVYREIKEILLNKWNTINQSAQLSQKHRYRC